MRTLQLVTWPANTSTRLITFHANSVTNFFCTHCGNQKAWVAYKKYPICPQTDANNLFILFVLVCNNYTVILLLVHKCLNGLAPTFLSELLHYHNSPHLLHSSSQNLLAVPRSRLKTYGDGACSVDQFKMQLKKYLFKLAYDV